MPGGDRTGPGGTGPMTGRAAGYCAGNNAPGYTNPWGGRGGGGWGRGFRGGGRGRGFGGGGRGRGFGWGAGGYYGPEPYAAPQPDPAQETEYLKSGIKQMEEEIKAMNKRIEELNKKEK